MVEWRGGAPGAKHHVSSSPSNIPYGGFSPVRLKTDIPPRPSRPLQPAAYTWSTVRFHRCLGIPLRGNHRLRGVSNRSAERVGPEALGSSAGYVVPPGRRLLWPHPSLWHPSNRLICFVRRTLGAPEGPNFYLLVLSSMPPALPRWIRWCHGASIATCIAFDVIRLSRHPRFRQLGLRRSRNEAAPVRLTLRPGRLLALHR